MQLLGVRHLAPGLCAGAPSVARQTVRPRKGLGRDVVPPTAASSLQPLMHQPQHLSGATAHIADRRGREVIASDHLKDVLDLPRRFVGMPQWVLDEVFATEVLVSNHRGCSLASLTSARRRRLRGALHLRLLHADLHGLPPEPYSKTETKAVAIRRQPCRAAATLRSGSM